MAGKKAYQQMLGLDRISSDTALIREKKVTRSVLTEQDPVCMALHYALRFGLTCAELCQRYGLRANTLSDIKKGKVIAHNRKLYAEKIVEAINCRRLMAIRNGDEKAVNEFTFALSELALVTYSVATDAELAEIEYERSREESNRRATKDGYGVDIERLMRTLNKA